MTEQYENPWDDPEFFRKPDAPLEPNTFSWFVALEHKLATLITSCVVHEDKKAIDLVLDMNAWVAPPKELRFPWPKHSQAYVCDALAKSSAQPDPQRFQLIIADSPRPFENWRRLEFDAIFAPVNYQEVSGLPADLIKQMKSMAPNTNEDFGKYTASFRLTVFGGIAKSGDWQNTQGYLTGKQLGKKPAQPVKTFDEKVEAAGKTFKNIASNLIDGSIETVQNLNRAAAASELNDKQMEKRQGSFHSRKLYPQLFEEIAKVLATPLNRNRWSVHPDPANSEITSILRWTEHYSGWGFTNPNAAREITATFRFDAHEDGTTITYDYLVYEDPPNSGIHTNQFIRITNQWIKSWADQAPGPLI